MSPLALAAAMSFFTISVGWPAESLLDRKFRATDERLGTLLMPADVVVFCRSARILCGAETAWIIEKKYWPVDGRRTFARRQSITVKRGLELLMEIHPGYRWEINDGVLNFFPKDPTAIVFGKTIPHRVVVSSFSQSGDTYWIAKHLIFKTSENLAAMRCKAMRWLETPIGGIPARDRSISQ